MATFITPFVALQVGDDRQVSYVRKLTQLSTAGGKFSVRAHSTVPVATHPITMELTSMAEIDSFWSWYDIVLGSLEGFWVPTFQRDLVPLAPIGPTDTTFQIQDRAYTELEFPANRYAVLFILSSGAYLQRQIDESVRNLDGTETLTLNQPLGTTFTQKRNTGICFLLFGRLSEDRVQMDWWSHEQATVQLQLVELPAPPLVLTADLGTGVWGAYHGPIGGGGAYFYVRYDLSPYVTPSNSYVVRFLVQSLGGQTVDVIGIRACDGTSCTASTKPGSSWVYIDRTFSSDASGNLYADIGHFAMQIGAAAIVEIAWLAVYDPDLDPLPTDDAGHENPLYPLPPTIPGRLVGLIPLGTYTLVQDAGQTSLGGCPPTSPDSAVCGLLLDTL